MKILELKKDKINGTLSFYDRIIINGYLLCLQSPRQFLFYLIQNNVKLKDFSEFSLRMSKELCDHIERYISDNGADLQYINNLKTDKGALAKEEFEKHPDIKGLVAAYSCVELCKTMTVTPNRKKKQLETASRFTKCKWYYLYFADEEFGWMYLKIQTWFPYNVQIYINGREYLSKLFDRHGIGYAMFNNSFSFISDFEKAQSIADKALNQKISSSFDGLINKINPHMDNISKTMNHTYYWCLEACEYARDITFKDRKDLESFYKKLVETSFYSFSCEDIYSFFGRNIKYMYKYKGDIIKDLRNRYEGYRIKFKMDANQLKMYDKYNSLRIEVTINNPRDFKVLKSDDETGEVKKWVPMGKSIANLYRYAEVSKSIISRFLNALPEFELNDVHLNDLQSISKTVEDKGRRYSPFNVFNTDTLKLFKVISSGNFLLNGFTNRDIRKIVYDSDDPKVINRTTRLLSKLKHHKMIKKVYRKNKYYLTDQGRRICSNLFCYVNCYLS